MAVVMLWQTPTVRADTPIIGKIQGFYTVEETANIPPGPGGVLLAPACDPMDPVAGGGYSVASGQNPKNWYVLSSRPLDEQTWGVIVVNKHFYTSIQASAYAHCIDQKIFFFPLAP